MLKSKSVPSPSLLMLIMSRFSSKTEIPVPSKVTLCTSFWFLNLKKTEEDMVRGYRKGRVNVRSSRVVVKKPDGFQAQIVKEGQ